MIMLGYKVEGAQKSGKKWLYSNEWTLPYIKCNFC